MAGIKNIEEPPKPNQKVF